MNNLRTAYRSQRIGRAGVRATAKARGSALIEFAFVLPLLAMLIFGMIDFGRALYAYHFVSNAAREATRWASVRGSQCTAWAQACPAGPADVQNYVDSIVPPGISPQALSVTAAWMPPPENPASCTASTKAPGCAVEVQVSYNFKFMLPFLPTGTYSMQSTSEMIISQ
jgi:Flp pilus assembly protein TadG